MAIKINYSNTNKKPNYKNIAENHKKVQKKKHALKPICLYVLYVFIVGDAIKCYDCNSLNNPGCRDEFRNFSTRIVDCARHDEERRYDLTPIDYCRKIKYKGNK